MSLLQGEGDEEGETGPVFIAEKQRIHKDKKEAGPLLKIPFLKCPQKNRRDSHTKIFLIPTQKES